MHRVNDGERQSQTEISSTEKKRIMTSIFVLCVPDIWCREDFRIQSVENVCFVAACDYSIDTCSA